VVPLAPLLLWFSALAGVPIIIHLLNKHRYRPVQWAAMEFLLTAIKTNSKRLQIRDLILMLIRAAAVACLCIALSRPAITGKFEVFGSHNKTAAVILIDNSYSMGYQSGESGGDKSKSKTRFDTAKRLAKGILEQLGKGAWCKIFTFNEEEHSPLGLPTTNLELLSQELDHAVQLSDKGSDLSRALDATKKLMNTHPEYQAASREIYIITDMQRYVWDPSNISGALLQDISKDSTVYLVDVSDAGGDNVGITNLECSDALATPGAEVTFTATLKNFGTQDMDSVQVSFFVDPSGDGAERPAERRALSIIAGQSTTIRFETVFPTGGDHRVEVRLEDDHLPADDRRAMTVEVIDSVRVLLVDGRDQKADTPLSTETGYLKHALTPSKEVEEGDKSLLIETDVVPYYSILDKTLSNYQAIALCNVESLAPQAVAAIIGQVKGGMGLMIFMGDRCDAANYNKTWEEILPAKIKDPTGEVPKIGDEKLPPSVAWSSDDNALSHPITYEFRKEDTRPLLEPLKVFRLFNFEPLKSDDVSVVASLADGRPAMIERKVGTGSVLLFPFHLRSLDAGGWTNLPVQPAMVVLMQRAATRLTLGNRPPRNLPVGGTIRGYLKAADAANKLQVTSPIGDREIQPLTNEGRSSFDFVDTEKAGFYRFAMKQRPDFKPLYFSLNPTVERESDLSKVNASDLRSQFPGFEFQYVVKSEDLSARLRDSKHGTEIWPWFMALVFILLALESILAYRWAPKN